MQAFKVERLIRSLTERGQSILRTCPRCLNDKHLSVLPSKKK